MPQGESSPFWGQNVDFSKGECDGVTNACYNKLMSLHLVPIYREGAREVWALLNGIFAWEDLV